MIGTVYLKLVGWFFGGLSSPVKILEILDFYKNQQFMSLARKL
jgi:hypothetical protein